MPKEDAAPGGDTTAPPADATATPPAGNDTTAAPATEPSAETPGTETPATAPATEPAAEEVPANQPLRDRVDDFWHYAKIARYDLAANLGKRILAEGQDQAKQEEILKNFEAVAAEHHDDLDNSLILWQGVPEMKQVATQVMGLLNQGRFARRQNPQFIDEQIRRLAGGQRGFMLAMQQLHQSGELAVPQLIDYLRSRDADKVQYHEPVRQALIDLGRAALNPLLAATEMKDQDTLVTIVAVLGAIDYRQVEVPYLLRLGNDPRVSGEVKSAVGNVLNRMGVNPRTNGGDEFYRLAELFYYDNAAVRADERNPVAFVWYWAGDRLVNKAVPPPIFGDIMAMRATEYALRFQPQNADNAVALWLAANIKRSVDLPQGATDPTRAANEPQPHYYNVSEGVKYLNLVLDRSLHDNTLASPAVALHAIKSLQEIVGESNLFSGGRGEPLVEAMRYPDRLVRFEAAFALAAALPQKSFGGQERVVPLLAEAVAQTGQAGVLIVAPSQAERNRLAADLKGYATAGGTNPAQAIADAAGLPAVDVILMPEDLGNPQIERVIALANQNPRLERAAKVIIARSKASAWYRIAVTDRSITPTQATGGPELARVIEDARKRVGGLPLDEKVASDYALRAASLLAKLAISRGQVFDLSAAQPQLLASLGDSRPPVAKAVGDVVALLNTKQAQVALADRANDPKTPEDVRVSQYKSLATSAKFYGNRLDQEQIAGLQQTVMGAQNLDLRSAAAEARGALNLPAQDAKALIVGRRD